MMRLLRWLLLPVLLTGFFVAEPAHAAFELGTGICETTTTTGTGTVNLDGAYTSGTVDYLSFASQITSTNTVPYTIESSDGKFEHGVGVFTDAAPDTLTRVAEWSSDGAGAELTLPAGTHIVCLQQGEEVLTGGVSLLDVASIISDIYLPGSDNAVDLGSTSFAFRDLFLTRNLELADSDTTIARTAAGEAAIEGDAVKHAGKQTIWIPAGAMYSDVTSPASCGDTYDSGSNDLTLKVCAFDTGATEERADFVVAFPKNWNESTVTAEFFWTNTAGASSSVAWEMGCVAVSNDDTLNATLGSTVVTVDAWIATNDLHVSPESSAITCGGTPAEADQVFFRINRDTSNGSDAMAGDALLTGVKLYYTDNASSDD